MGKGLSLISGVIFLALTISATVIIYEAGVPLIKRMQAASIVEKMKDTMSELDKIIREVASEGKGSKRTVSLNIDLGELRVNETEDSITWSFDTDALIISPRTVQRFGNLIIGSNLDTKAYEENYTGASPEIPCYILENEHLKVYIRKIGNRTSWEGYNTSEILVAMYQKDLGKWLNNQGFLDISIGNSITSKSGNGYTVPEELGYNLPYASVGAYVNNSYNPYYVNFTLESGTDFLEIGASV